jgi:hypothetical protein
MGWLLEVGRLYEDIHSPALSEILTTSMLGLDRSPAPASSFVDAKG